jgi:plastocyanin
VRSRKRHLSLLAIAVAGVAALLLSGAAQGQAPPTAAIVAADDFFRTGDGGPPSVTIVAGGNVDFSYPSGNSRHNVVFTGAQPSACGVSQGPASSTSAPLPNSPALAPWDGGCTFADPGTYPFVCALHGNMTGSVRVVAAGAVPPPSVPPPAPSPPPPPPAVPPAPPAAVAPAASGLRVASRQRGSTVRGSVRVRSAGSRVLTRAFARRNALYGGRSLHQVQVGRRARSSAPSGRVAFSVALNAAARRALRRNGRLSISLRLTVTPPQGSAYTATRAVVLRPA